MQKTNEVETLLSPIGTTKGNCILDEERQAGIIVRVSTPHQGEEGTSLETQEERCRAAAKKDGYKVKPEHVWRCIESGAHMNRRGLEMALQAVKPESTEGSGEGAGTGHHRGGEEAVPADMGRAEPIVACCR